MTGMQSLRFTRNRIIKKEKKRLKMVIKPRSKGNGGVPTVTGSSCLLRHQEEWGYTPQSGLSHMLSPGSLSDTNFCILATYVLNLNLENKPRNMYFLIRCMGLTLVNQKYVFLISSAPV